MEKGNILVLLILFTSLIFATSIVEGQCDRCHKETGGAGCLNCHTDSYVVGTAHQPLRSAILYRSPPPYSTVNDRRYCSCHFGYGERVAGGPVMPLSPACSCHVVIHINLNRHRSTHPAEVLVEGYLPLSNHPYVSPGLYYKQAKIWYNCTRAPANCPPNLYQLVNSVYGAGYRENVVLVALWDWYVGDVILPTPGYSSVLGSYGGSYGSVANASWLSCFNCHFAAVNPWDVAGYINSTKSTLPGTQYLQHPDLCQPCHGRVTTFYERTTRLTYWSHNITGYKAGGSDAVWGFCGECHSAISSIVRNSVHSMVGCKCHSVIHIGYSYQQNWLAALFTFEGDTAGVALPFETAPHLMRLAVSYMPYNATPGVRQLLDAVLGRTPGRNVEVGLWEASINDYLSTLPLGLGPNVVWNSCLNCHFISSDPALASNPHAIGWRVVIPTWSVKSEEANIETPRGKGGTGIWGVALALLIMAAGFAWLMRKD